MSGGRPKRKFDAADVDKAAHYLRNNSSLEVYDCRALHRRVECFEGPDFVEIVCSAKFRAKTGINVADATAACKLGSLMIQAGHIHRSTIEETTPEFVKVVPSHTHSFAEDGYYTWLLRPSQTRIYVLAVLFVIVSIGLTMIKVWPLWMKIAVWWMSVIMLVSIISIVLLRLVVWALCFAVGLRGMWLCPNLFEDDIDFLESFTPLFEQDTGRRRRARRKQPETRKRQLGQRDSVASPSARAARRAKAAKSPSGKLSKKERIARRKREQQDDASVGSTDSAQTADTDVAPSVDKSAGSAAPAKEEDEEEVLDWKFGLLNFGLMLLVGLGVAQYMGLFAPEHIPEFVLSKVELWHQWPSLAPPNMTQNVTDLLNETAEAAEELAEELLD